MESTNTGLILYADNADVISNDLDGMKVIFGIPKPDTKEIEFVTAVGGSKKFWKAVAQKILEYCL